jgi:hypothetical protein
MLAPPITAMGKRFMTELAQMLLRRWKGLRIIAFSLSVGLAGMLPLLAYTAFGPRDGNPIGLGLLAASAVAIATVGVLAGMVSVFAQVLARASR